MNINGLTDVGEKKHFLLTHVLQSRPLNRKGTWRYFLRLSCPVRLQPVTNRFSNGGNTGVVTDEERH